MPVEAVGVFAQKYSRSVFEMDLDAICMTGVAIGEPAILLELNATFDEVERLIAIAIDALANHIQDFQYLISITGTRAVRIDEAGLFEAIIVQVRIDGVWLPLFSEVAQLALKPASS
jgi:hypothetical protein